MTISSPRIFYVCHDNPRPSGGIRMLYRHVEMLNRAGLDARVLHFQTGFRLNWFNSNAPVTDTEQSPVGGIAPGDWVVFPEDHSAAMQRLAGAQCHKVVFCQNHFYIFDALEVDNSWADFGIEEALVSSIAIRDFVESVFKLPTTFIPCGIDQDIFRPPTRAPGPSVCFMPRKGGSNLRTILGTLWHRNPTLRKLAWRPIDSVSETQVAEIMRASTIFLATGMHEGLGLPPLEAMACGCLPVGFKAVGGQDYATTNNGIWVPDEDPFALARALEQVLNDVINNPRDARWERLRQAGYATAARYTLHHQRQALIDFWKARINR